MAGLFLVLMFKGNMQNHLCRGLRRATPLLLILSLASVVISQPVDTTATDSVETSVASNPQYTVTIERLLVEDMRVDDTLGVYLRTSGARLAGFDLKIGTVGDLFEIVEILPGEIYDSCGWEFFNARQVQSSGTGLSPLKVWQVVAIADMLSGEGAPECFGFDVEASLLKLVVSNEFVGQVPDTSIPIFFIWEDCSDNTVSGQGGDTLSLSRSVFDFYQSGQIVSGNPFPTIQGAPRDCIKAGSLNRPQRRIDFHNGGIEFKFNIEPDSVLIDNQRE